MTDEQKREYAEAIKHALGMASPEFGPPMEGEEGWVPVGPEEALRTASRNLHCGGVPPAGIGWHSDPVAVARALFGWPTAAMTVEDADDEDFDATAQAIMDELREKKERRMAEERAKAAEPKPAPPSDDPWAVIGKAEDDGEWIMKKIRDFG